MAVVNYGPAFAIGSEVGFSSNLTTTSLTDVVVTGMTITPAAGSYLVLFSTFLRHSNGNATINMSIYVGGVQVATSNRQAIPFVGALSAITQSMPLAINEWITVDGTQAIDVRWKTSTGTATAGAGTFTIVKLG